MTVVLQRREQKHPGGGQSRDKRSRNYSAVAEKPRNAKEGLQTPPDTWKKEEAFSPTGFLGSMALPILRFQTSGLQNSERSNFSCIKLLSLLYLLQQLQETNTAWFPHCKIEMQPYLLHRVVLMIK